MRSKKPRCDHRRKTPSRLPYRAPRLILHGTVRDLTMSTPGGSFTDADLPSTVDSLGG